MRVAMVDAPVFTLEATKGALQVFDSPSWIISRH
jgi:hypothetical protein